MNDMNYLVKKVVAENDYTLLIDFITGERKRFDMKPVIARGGIFERLKDPDFFNKAHVDRDTVVWDDTIDIAPESLYAHGLTVT